MRAVARMRLPRAQALACPTIASKSLTALGLQAEDPIVHSYPLASRSTFKTQNLQHLRCSSTLRRWSLQDVCMYPPCLACLLASFYLVVPSTLSGAPACALSPPRADSLCSDLLRFCELPLDRHDAFLALAAGFEAA